MKNFGLLGIVVWLAVSCATIAVSPVETASTPIFVLRGQKYVKAENGTISVLIHAQNLGSEVLFRVSIANKTENPIFFDEANSLSVEVGTHEQNIWKTGEWYTATNYYEKEKQRIVALQVLRATSAALSSLNAGYSRTMYQGSSTTYGPSGAQTRYDSGQIVTYDPVRAQMEFANSMNNFLQEAKNDAAYLNFLSENLLYSSVIPPKSVYSGIVFVPLQKTPDLKMVFLIQGEVMELIFRRSDAAELSSPLSSYVRDRGYLGYLYTPAAPLGFSIGYLTKGVSFFLDNSLQLPEWRGYTQSYLYTHASQEVIMSSYAPLYDQKQTTQFVYEGVLGMNYRLLDHLWMNGGLGYFYRNVYRLYLQDWTYLSDELLWLGETKPTSTAVFQSGLLFGIGPVFLSGSLRYRFGVNFDFALGGGVTF